MSAASPTVLASRRDPLRYVVVISLAAALILLLARVAVWLGVAFRALNYPFELDYAEGIVWQQANMIHRGVAYGDITQSPFIVFHYPPLFHLAAIATSVTSGADILISGRAVSIAAAIGTAATLGRLVFSAREYDRTTRSLCALATTLLVLAFEPVEHWSVTCRVDTLATFWSALGLYFGFRSLDREVWGHLGAVCFVAAVFTKPTAIAAPLALTLFMLWKRPVLVRKGLLSAMFAFVAAAALAVGAFGLGLPTHVLTYNINRLHLPNLNFVVLQSLIHLSCVTIATVLAFRCLGSHWAMRGGARELGDRPRTSDDLRLLASIHFCVASASTLAIVKSGADSNYLIEWFVSIGLLLGTSLLTPVSRARHGDQGVSSGDGPPRTRDVEWRWPHLAAASYLLALQFLLIRDLPVAKRFQDAQALEQSLTLLDEVRNADRPVASEDMVITMRANKQVIFEPMIIKELVAVGTWDETALVRMVEERKFAFFVTRGRDDHDRVFGWPYSPLMTRAIFADYPKVARLGEYWIRRP